MAHERTFEEKIKKPNKLSKFEQQILDFSYVEGYKSGYNDATTGKDFKKSTAFKQTSKKYWK